MAKHILVVDDDHSWLKLMCRVLKQAGHVVHAASTGAEAKAALATAHFDVAITDIFMPDMDGLELIRHICATAPDTPIIAVSGGATRIPVSLLSIAAALGADMTLAKPIRLDALREAVDRVSVDWGKGSRYQPLDSCNLKPADIAEPAAGTNHRTDGCSTK